MQGTKPRILQRSTLLQVEGSNWELNKKNETCTFGEMLLETSGSSILIALFGIPLMWRSHGDKFHENYLQNENIHFDPRETKLFKKLIPKN